MIAMAITVVQMETLRMTTQMLSMRGPGMRLENFNEYVNPAASQVDCSELVIEHLWTSVYKIKSTVY